jgi:hypothetical protein
MGRQVRREGGTYHVVSRVSESDSDEPLANYARRKEIVLPSWITRPPRRNIPAPLESDSDEEATETDSDFKEKKKKTKDWKILPVDDCNEATHYLVKGYAVDGHCRKRPRVVGPTRPRVHKKKPKKRNKDQKLKAWQLEPESDCDETEYKVKGYVVNGHCRKRPSVRRARSEGYNDDDKGDSDGGDDESDNDEASNGEYSTNMSFGQQSSPSSDATIIYEDPADIDSQDSMSSSISLGLNQPPGSDISEGLDHKHSDDPIYVGDDSEPSTTNNTIRRTRWLSEESMSKIRTVLGMSDCSYAAPDQVVAEITALRENGNVPANIIANTSTGAGQHWLLVSVSEDQIHVRDPMSGYAQSAAMRNINGNFTGVTYEETKQQNDGWSCGWRVLYWAFSGEYTSPPALWYDLVPLLVRVHAFGGVIENARNMPLDAIVVRANQLIGGHGVPVSPPPSPANVFENFTREVIPENVNELFEDNSEPEHDSEPESPFHRHFGQGEEMPAWRPEWGAIAVRLATRDARQLNDAHAASDEETSDEETSEEESSSSDEDDGGAVPEVLFGTGITANQEAMPDYHQSTITFSPIPGLSGDESETEFYGGNDGLFVE